MTVPGCPACRRPGHIREITALGMWSVVWSTHEEWCPLRGSVESPWRDTIPAAIRAATMPVAYCPRCGREVEEVLPDA